MDSIIVRDSKIGSSQIRMLNAIDAPGMQYDTTLVRLERVEADNPETAVYAAQGRPVKVVR